MLDIFYRYLLLFHLLRPPYHNCRCAGIYERAYALNEQAPELVIQACLHSAMPYLRMAMAPLHVCNNG